MQYHIIVSFKIEFKARTAIVFLFLYSLCLDCSFEYVEEVYELYLCKILIPLAFYQSLLKIKLN